MIGYLKGEVAGIYEDKILLEVNNVGYNIYMSASSIAQIDSMGAVIKVYTYLNVREDALLLYGFLTKDDLDFFKLLISVNGIGPKGGLAILSTMTTDDLRFAILSEDAKKIGKAPGVGPKTAQRVVIELKDKVTCKELFEVNSFEGNKSANNDNLSSPREEAAMALVALGYSSTESYKAVRLPDINPDDSVETIIKKALKGISKF